MDKLFFIMPIVHYSLMLGRGYLDNRDLGKLHCFTFGVVFGEGVDFLLKVKSCGGVEPILRLIQSELKRHESLMSH